MFDRLHLPPKILLFFRSNRQSKRGEPSEPMELQNDERCSDLSNDWRRALDRIRYYEYPIDYEDL
jgi:hypothetical protein